MVKYLGELYNYRVVDSIIIFRTLYLLITFGVHLDGKNDCINSQCFIGIYLATELNELDPPEHLFRIRLVCTLLDTCGQYFDRGTSKKRLDCFLVYFQVNDHTLFHSDTIRQRFSFDRDIIISRENYPFGMP